MPGPGSLVDWERALSPNLCPLVLVALLIIFVVVYLCFILFG